MLRIKTASGSTYTFDNEGMEWRRESDHDIMFLEGVNGGPLAAPVEPRLDERLTFFLPGDEWVVTTEVQSIEEVPTW